jgi:hypothetical protein
MPNFKDKEEYEKWKVQRSLPETAKDKTSQNGVEQQISSSSKTKQQGLRFSLITILLIIVVGLLFIGYQKYESYKKQEIEKKEQIKAQEIRREELHHVIQQFKDLESALKVGLSKFQYNERLVNIRIELDKFENKHKAAGEQPIITSLLLLEKAFQAYEDGKDAWGDDYKISLTNWQGKLFPTYDELLEKYPLLKDKIRRHDYTAEGSTYLIQEIFRSDYRNIVWAYAADYTRKAESSF